MRRFWYAILTLSFTLFPHFVFAYTGISNGSLDAWTGGVADDWSAEFLGDGTVTEEVDPCVAGECARFDFPADLGQMITSFSTLVNFSGELDFVSSTSFWLRSDDDYTEVVEHSTRVCSFFADVVGIGTAFGDPTNYHFWNQASEEWIAFSEGGIDAAQTCIFVDEFTSTYAEFTNPDQPGDDSPTGEVYFIVAPAIDALVNADRGFLLDEVDLEVYSVEAPVTVLTTSTLLDNFILRYHVGLAWIIGLSLSLGFFRVFWVAYRHFKTSYRQYL